jgi:outer membrane protein assembly factor BamD (BamD/ComL family)
VGVLALLGGRRSRQIAFAAAGVVIAVVVFAVLFNRHAPIEEARRFLTAPVELGDRPPLPAGGPVPRSEVEGRYAAARAAFEAGRYAEAAESFAWVVARDPRGPEAGDAQWNLTRSRLRSGDGMGALESLDGLLRHYAAYLGESAPTLREGLGHMERGELRRAAAAFERFVDEDPYSEFVPLAHALRARIHWVHGEPMATVASFGRMFASVRDAVPEYGRLANQLERYARGDRSVADSFSRLAEDGDEGFRDIYQYLAARSLLEQDRFTAARDALEELSRRYPEGDFGHIVDLEHAWNLLRHGEAAAALEIFRRLEQTAAPARAAAFDDFFDLRAEVPMGIARCQLALGNWDEAAAAFEHALSEHPRSLYDVENRVSLAIAYERGGRLRDAAHVLHEVIDAHPDEPKMWAVRQQLARIEGQLAAAD